MKNNNVIGKVCKIIQIKCIYDLYVTTFKYGERLFFSPIKDNWLPNPDIH